MPRPGKTYVLVRWLDAKGESKWQTEDELPQLMEVITCGWLVTDEPTMIRTAASYYYDDGTLLWGEVLAIPQGCIIEIKEIGL